MYPANILGNISPLPSRKEGSTAHYIDPTAILLFVGKTKQKTGKNRRLCGRLNVYWRKERRVPPQQRPKQLVWFPPPPLRFHFVLGSGNS